MGDMLRRAVHLKDLSWIPQPETCTTERTTHLSEDDEDKLRKAMFALFDLKPLELLVLQGIMRQQTLQEIATSLTELFKNNNKECTRHHVFQLRKAILNKLPQFGDALLTEGQRRELKP